MTAPMVASRRDARHLPPRTLTLLRSALLHELAGQTLQATEGRATVRDLAGQNDADSVAERDLAEQAAARADDTIADIQHALDRLRSGTYGTCERCGAPVPLGRLEAIPHARNCVDCQDRRAGLLG